MKDKRGKVKENVRTARLLSFEFPWSLKEEEVCKIFQSYSDNAETKKEVCYIQAFIDAGVTDKINLRKYYLEHAKEGNKVCYHKFRWLLNHLISHPALKTDAVQKVIDGSELLRAVFKVKGVSIVPAGENQIAVITTDNSELSPLAKEELIKSDIMDNLLDKMQGILHAITAQKISKSSMGTLSKSLENMVKSYTIFKSEGVSKNFLQVNIGHMNLQQKKELSLKMSKD